MARKPGRRGKFEEAQAPFALDAPDLQAVFAAYGWCCGFTGLDLRTEATADPAGALLRLAPLGPITLGAVIPASLEAIYAYERGHLALGSRCQFLVALDRIDPEFLERLNPIGRLTLPADTAFAPRADLLKVHRAAFVEGLID
ncbi:MAG TPA: hypothetical protein VHZ56_03140 [Devosia sp.]|nr:hypothetical protein [Devosia sp.]